MRKKIKVSSNSSQVVDFFEFVDNVHYCFMMKVDDLAHFMSTDMASKQTKLALHNDCIIVSIC